MLSPRASRKIKWLRFVCALMIVALHTAFDSFFPGAAPWTRELNRAVRSAADAAVPVFFFLSALLLYREGQKENYAALLKKKARSLLIPYLLWNLLTILYDYARACLTLGGWAAFPGPLRVLREMTVDPCCYILWFVKALMGYTLLYPVIGRAVDRKWPALAAGAAAAVICAAGLLPVPYESMLYWLPVYLMGAAAGRLRFRRFTEVPVCRGRSAYRAAAAAFLLLACIRPADGWLHYFYWLPAPLLLWILADAFSGIRFDPWWTGASFYLYCAHLFFEPLSRKLYLRVFGTGTAACAAGNVLLPLLCAAFALIPAAFLRRTRLFAVLTGERSLTRGRK